MKFGLLGNNLSHSFSKKFFEKFFFEHALNGYAYDLYPFNQLQDVALFLQSTQCKGLNVTIPYKQTLLPYIQKLTPLAAKTGAVNALVNLGTFKKPFWLGHNTDVTGVLAALMPFDSEIKGQKAIVLGNGGAAKAVTTALALLHMDYLQFSRNPTPQQFNLNELQSQHVLTHKLIIQTTPVGMFPHTNECLPMPWDHISENNICFDLIYNPETTKWLQLAQKQGATTLNGLTMLHAQAHAAWEFWSQPQSFL